MFWLLKAGGFPMVFVALFGLAALTAAVGFLRRPDRRRIDFIRLMSWATLGSVGAGTAACLAAVGIHVVRNPAWAKSPEIHLIVMEGLAESMAPAIVGFTLLSLTAFLSALAVRRVPRED